MRLLASLAVAALLAAAAAQSGDAFCEGAEWEALGQVRGPCS